MPTEYTVTEVTRYLSTLIGNDPFLQRLWVRGEISNFTHHSSGHMYFTLKDDDARIRSVMFRGQNRLLKFLPSNGMMVLVQGSVSLYEKSGDYQLYVEWMEPAGIGALNLAYEQLKERLGQEGLFDSGRKRALPRLPQKIALITSPTGAAIRDLIHVLRRRRPHLDILVIPAAVQGSEAPTSLVSALRLAGRLSELDLVIIGRGGGSLEELWAFNDEDVARAIALCPHPVISAVGHETDFTIADFVADLRAPTPSAAAEMAVPDQRELERDVNVLKQRMVKAEERYLDYRRRTVEQLRSTAVLSRPERWLRPMQQHLDEVEGQLTRVFPHRLQEQQLQLRNLLGKLDSLSPLATLARGYSITRHLPDGTVVMDARDVAHGAEVAVRLTRGELRCRVEERIEEETINA